MQQFIISARTLETVVKNLAAHAQQPKRKSNCQSVIEGILISVDNGRLEMVATDGYRLLSADFSDRNIAGDYPNYRQIFPSAFRGRLQANASDLLSAVKAMPVSRFDPGIFLQINGKVVVKSQNSTATVPATIEHSEPDLVEETLKLDRDYLLDAIKAVEPSEEVVLQWNSPTSAIMVQAATESPAVSVLVMPIRS